MAQTKLSTVPLKRDGNAFEYQAEIFFDDLDAMAMLHNARYAVYVERAIAALYGTTGRHWTIDPAENPDQFHVVREASFQYVRPFRGVGPLVVDLWVVRLGTTSCQYGFRFRSQDGSVIYATGRRLIIKLDQVALRPIPWSHEFLVLHQPLVAGDWSSGRYGSGYGYAGLAFNPTGSANGALHSTREVRVDEGAGEGQS